MAFSHELPRPNPGSEGKGGGSGEAATPGGMLVLTLDDVLSRVPTRSLQPGLHDPTRELHFAMDELLDGISRGRATILLSKLAERYPETFQAPAPGTEDTAIFLPLQKLIQQIGRATRRAPEKLVLPPLEPVASAPAAPAPTALPAAIVPPKEVPLPAPPVVPPKEAPVPEAVVLPKATPEPEPVVKPLRKLMVMQDPVDLTPPKAAEEPPRAVAVPAEAPPLPPKVTEPEAPPAPVEPPKAASVVEEKPPLKDVPAAVEAALPNKVEPASTPPGEGTAKPDATEETALPPVTPAPMPSLFSRLASLVSPAAEAAAPPAPPEEPKIVAAFEEKKPVLEVAAPPTPAEPPSPLIVESKPEPPPAPKPPEPAPIEEPKLAPVIEEKKIEMPVVEAFVEVAPPFSAPPPPPAMPPQEAKQQGPQPPPLPVTPPPEARAPAPEPRAPMPEPEPAVPQSPVLGNPPPNLETGMRMPGRPMVRPPSLQGPAGVVAADNPPPASPAVPGFVFAPRASAPLSDFEHPAFPPEADLPTDVTIPPLFPLHPPAPKAEEKAPEPPAPVEAPHAPEPPPRPPEPEPATHVAPTPAEPPATAVEAHEPAAPHAPPEPPVAAQPEPAPEVSEAPSLPPELEEEPAEERQISHPTRKETVARAHDLLGTHFSLARIDQEPLQAIFMTEEFLDLARVSQLSCNFPGITGCMIVAGDALAHGGERPAGFDAPALCQLTKQLSAVAVAFPDELPTVQTYTLHIGNRALSIFARPHVSLCLVHSHRGFLPGVRERLAAVADTLSRGLSGEAEQE